MSMALGCKDIGIRISVCDKKAIPFPPKFKSYSSHVEFYYVTPFKNLQLRLNQFILLDIFCFFKPRTRNVLFLIKLQICTIVPLYTNI